MKFIFIFLLAFYSQSLRAEIHGGAAVPSAMHGRTTLGIHVGYADAKYSGSIYAAGVKTPTHYHNVYQTGLFWILGKDDFLFGKLVPAFGFGILYSIRGYSGIPDT